MAAKRGVARPPVPEDRLPTECPECGAGDLTRVPIVLADGTDVVFVACGGCEIRAWLVEEAATWRRIPIEHVLASSARRR